MNQSHKKISVVGGGLIGLVAAMAISHTISPHDGEVVLIAPKPRYEDKRTTAVLMPTIAMLERLGVWEDLRPVSAALATMRIIDASGRLIAAPTVEFRSSEIGQKAFGYNIPNDAAAEIFKKALSHQANVTIIDASVIAFDALSNRLELDNGSALKADLVVAADGRHSLLRKEVGIETRVWSYPQTALVTSFCHTLAHDGVSTELHTQSGPFTQVPLPPHQTARNRSSLVWVVTPREAEELRDWNKNRLSAEIEKRLQSSLGKVSLDSDLQSFPLTGMTAQKFAIDNVFLVGEAAHVMPPIGAQGFNLGANDIKCLCSLLTKGFSPKELSALYDKKRRPEVFTKMGGIDLLNRSLLTGFLPLQLARSAALSALSGSSILRKLLMTGLMKGPDGLINQGKDQPAKHPS